MKRLICEKNLWKIPRKSGRFLDKFLHHNCNCPHTSQNSTVNRIPEIVPLSVLKLGPYSDRNEPVPTMDVSNRRAGFSSTYQSFHQISNKILVGKMVSGPRGQIYFSDGSEFLPLLLLNNPGIQVNGQEAPVSFAPNCTGFHTCTGACVNGKRLGEYLPCSCMDSMLINKVILVSCFTIVAEQHQNSCDQIKEDKMIYLTFCLQSCVMIQEHDCLLKAALPLSHYPLSNFPVSTKRRAKHIYHVSIEKKMQLYAKHLTDILEFEVVGHIVIVKSCENLPSDPSISKELPGEIKNGAFENYFMDSSECHSSPSSSKDGKKTVVPQSLCKRTYPAPVSVIFSGAASNCYNFLHAGNCYILETSEDLLVPNLSNEHLQRAAQYCCVGQQTKITESVKVRRFEATAPKTIENLPKYSITDILSEGFSDPVVSFRCQIHTRYTSNLDFGNTCKHT
ncbi:hypothetical protein EGW08_010792, partial [Elysia chlorotica]